MFVVEHVTAERWPVGHAPAGVNIASKEIIIGGTEMAEMRVISKEARVVEEFVVGKTATDVEVEAGGKARAGHR